MLCKDAVYNQEEGQYYCGTSGKECKYYIPDSIRCATEYNMGPDVHKILLPKRGEPKWKK